MANMEDLRPQSYKDTRMQMGNGDNNYANNHSSYKSGMQDLRCCSASSYASSTYAAAGEYNGQMDIVVAPGGGEQWKFKKGKSTSGVASRNWGFSDPELQRKKRVASYKTYTVEGKLKGSIKKSFWWFKERCNQMIYGYR